MPYGLQVIGNDGYKQIDENYANLSFVGKGTMSIGGSVNNMAGPTTFYSGSQRFNRACNRPLVFIRPTQGYACLASIVNGGSYLDIYLHGNTSQNVDFYVFDQITTDEYGGFGLQVFNAAGQLTYSSNYAPLRIKAIVPGQSGSLLNNSVGPRRIATLDAGTYAALASTKRIDSVVRYEGSRVYSIWYSEMLGVNATELNLNYGPTNYIPATSRASQNDGGQYMVIKVDNL